MVPTVSVGSTPSCSQFKGLFTNVFISLENVPGVNEIHPGNFVLFDRQQLALGRLVIINSHMVLSHLLSSCKEADIAVGVLASVIAVYPSRNEIALDAGATALSKDPCSLVGFRIWSSPQCPLIIQGGYGHLSHDPTLQVTRVTQEIALVKSIDEAVRHSLV